MPTADAIGWSAVTWHGFLLRANSPTESDSVSQEMAAVLGQTQTRRFPVLLQEGGGALNSVVQCNICLYTAEYCVFLLFFLHVTYIRTGPTPLTPALRGNMSGPRVVWFGVILCLHPISYFSSLSLAESVYSLAIHRNACNVVYTQ